MDSKKLVALLEKDGWVMDRQKGSHRVFGHKTKKGIVVVPMGRKDLPTGTLRQILKSAGLRIK